eukprot:TRINITY_DN122051_c0_g1_i1.p1 TRINITY_DN122051_c0_g1~~TRINITY_DN122051_c0_g1_i1.p1  ORF type:complete len:350 (-),score=70.64 TRINITY_DN122051_c0_g1_i1:102-1151(-)
MQQPAAKRARREPESLTYSQQRVLGRGSFGVVYQAQVLETGEIVAIKCCRLQDKDREIQVLNELKGHPNIIGLKGAFMSDENTAEPRINVVLEFSADTLHRVIKHYNKIGKKMDFYFVKLYSYQMMRSLLWMHAHGIVHCDVKPQNLLLDGRSQTVKLCDFGTAKRLVSDDQSLIAYVCSRYYRAPELILGTTGYTNSIDVWSAGCVVAEMILGQPIFTGKDGIHQLCEIMHVLGTPTPQEVKAMNPDYSSFEFTPKLERLDWERVCQPARSHQGANDVLSSLLKYDPVARITPLQCLLHSFYDVLRSEDRPAHRMLFNFMKQELWFASEPDRRRLIPTWYRNLTAPPP